MMQKEYTDFEKCSKLSKKKRKKLLIDFLNFSTNQKVECLNRQYIFLGGLKNDYNTNVAPLCAFYKSIQKIEKIEKKDFEIYSFYNFDQKKLIGFFGKQDLIIQIKIFREQKNQFHKNKGAISKEILPLFSFFTAINIFYKKFKQKFYKNKTYNLKSQNSIAEINILKDIKQTSSVKKERFLNYISVAKKLIEVGYSYRKISEHFEKYYQFKISHMYIKKMVDRFLKEK